MEIFYKQENDLWRMVIIHDEFVYIFECNRYYKEFSFLLSSYNKKELNIDPPVKKMTKIHLIELTPSHEVAIKLKKIYQNKHKCTKPNAKEIFLAIKELLEVIQ